MLGLRSWLKLAGALALRVFTVKFEADCITTFPPPPFTTPTHLHTRTYTELHKHLFVEMEAVE